MAGGDAAVRAAQLATSEIPVLALTDDMVGQGFLQSLAKPGANITGATILGSELDSKRQEILIGAAPAARKIAALARISHRGRCIGRLDLRKSCCDNGLSQDQGEPDADRV